MPPHLCLAPPTHASCYLVLWSDTRFDVHWSVGCVSLLFATNYACWRYAKDFRGLDISSLGVTPFLLASSCITMGFAGILNNWAQMKDRRLSHMITCIIEHENADDGAEMELDNIANASKYSSSASTTAGLSRAVAAAAEAQIEWRAIQNSRRKATICGLCCSSD